MLDVRRTGSDVAPFSKSPQDIDSDAAKWSAVIARDASKDGTFVVGVRSTGIYCKPSCPAKHPRMEQVLFFSRPYDAETAGFRACLRCHPNGGVPTRTEQIQIVCDYIKSNLSRRHTLSSLSSKAGLSPFHFQRTFRKVLGVSPREYVEALRLERMKHSLRQGETVINALYKAGFSSRSRVYEKNRALLGVNPGAFRRGGKGLQIGYTIVDSPIGRLLLGATDRGLCAVCIGGSDQTVEAALREDYYAADLRRDDHQMMNWAKEFSKYFGGTQLSPALPIDVQATAFQWKVWKQIQAIPYGATLSYSEIAEKIGKPRAVRAVANACGANHVALLIPCHRVVGKNGRLGGYGWGVRRKRMLLSMESKRSPREGSST